MIRWAIRMLRYKSINNFEVLGLGFELDEQRLLNIEQRIEYELVQLKPNHIEEIEINCLIGHLQELINEKPQENYSQFQRRLMQIMKPCMKPSVQKWLEKIILETADIGHAKFEETFGWLTEQNAAINLYSTLLQMVEVVESEIKTKGLNRQSVDRAQNYLIILGQCGRSKAFANDVMEFLEQQVARVPLGQNYLGSTDIIESLIGKFKLLNFRVAVNGINQSALLFGSITAQITPEKIKTAMETVPWSKVKQWFEEKVPLSNWAKRCQAFLSGGGKQQLVPKSTKLTKINDQNQHSKFMLRASYENQTSIPE